MLKRFPLAVLALALVAVLFFAADASACPACMAFISRKLGLGFFWATMILLAGPFAGMAWLGFIVWKALKEPPRAVPARARFQNLADLPPAPASPDVS